MWEITVFIIVCLSCVGLVLARRWKNEDKHAGSEVGRYSLIVIGLIGICLVVSRCENTKNENFQDFQLKQMQIEEKQVQTPKGK